VVCAKHRYVPTQARGPGRGGQGLTCRTSSGKPERRRGKNGRIDVPQPSRDTCRPLVFCACQSNPGTIMNLPRRRFLHLAAGGAVLPAMSRIAKAQAYPTRPRRRLAAPLSRTFQMPIAAYLRIRHGHVPENAKGHMDKRSQELMWLAIFAAFCCGASLASGAIFFPAVFCRSRRVCHDCVPPTVRADPSSFVSSTSRSAVWASAALEAGATRTGNSSMVCVSSPPSALRLVLWNDDRTGSGPVTHARGMLRYFHWAFSHGRSTSMTGVSVNPPASFARRYRLSIALGVLVVVAVIMGLRLSLDHLAEQPIVGSYARKLVTA
jgi:hypothetical protein